MNSTRRVVDLILQAATVELFHAYGLAVGPTETQVEHIQRWEDYEAIGIVPFWGTGFQGNLVLVISDRTLGEVRQLAMEAGNRDRTRELTNQLMGHFKNRLIRFGVTLRVGLPSSMESRVFERQLRLAGDTIIHRFRTVRDDVFVILRGKFDYTSLVFSNAVYLPREGDVLLF